MCCTSNKALTLKIAKIHGLDTWERKTININIVQQVGIRNVCACVTMRRSCLYQTGICDGEAEGLTWK